MAKKNTSPLAMGRMQKGSIANKKKKKDEEKKKAVAQRKPQSSSVSKMTRQQRQNQKTYGQPTKPVYKNNKAKTAQKQQTVGNSSRTTQTTQRQSRPAVANTSSEMMVQRQKPRTGVETAQQRSVDPKEARRQESARAMRSAARRFASEDRRTAAQAQKMNMPTAEEQRRSRENIRAAGKAISNSVKESMTDESRARMQRQKSGIQTEEDKRYNEQRNQRRIEVAKNTGRAAKKGVEDTLTGYGKTLADIDEMAKSSDKWTEAKSMKLGIDKNDTAGRAKVEEERQKSIKEARRLRLDLGEKQEKRQKEFDEATKNAKGLEKAWYGAVESGTGMATDMAVGALTGTGQVGALASMGIRSYGTTRGQAEKEGATENEDRLYSLLQAGKEVGTEMMFQGAGLAKSAFSGGKVGLSLADRAANRLTRNMTGRAADATAAGIRLLGGTAEENAEEAAGWLADPVIKELTYGRNVRQRAAKAALKQESDAIRSGLTSEEDARSAAAYLNSDRFIEENIKQYMDAGLSEKRAREVSEQMRDYLAASLSGDTDRMAELEDSIAATMSGRSLKDWLGEFDKGELADTFASTSLLTLTTGLPAGISTAARGSAIRDSLGTEGLRALSETAINFEDGVASLKAQAARDRIDEGKELTSTQVYDLAQAQAQQVEKDFKRSEAASGVAETRIKNENYVMPELSFGRDGSVAGDEVIAANYVKESNAATDIIEDLMEQEGAESLTDTEVQNGSRAIAGFKTGAFTVADANALNYTNTTVRTAFSEATGVDLNQYVVEDKQGNIDIPKTNAATKDALFAMAADNYVKTAEAETANWMDNAKGEVVTEVTSRMGAQGSVALQAALDDVDERDRSTYMMNANAADMMYQTARNMGTEWNTVKAEAARMFPKISEQKLEDMYNAGLKDRADASTAALGKQVKIGDAMDLSGEAETPKGNVFIDTEYSPKGSVVRVFSEIATNLGVDIHLVDDLRTGTGTQANGQYINGAIYININSDFEKNVGYIFMHEVTHHLKLYAPEQFNALENLVRERWFSANPEEMQNEISKRIDLYRRNGQNLSEEEALEEIIADAAHEFINDSNFARQAAETDPSLAKAILNGIKDALRAIRRILALSNLDDETHMNTLFSQLGILDEAEKLWLDAYTQAVKNRAAVGIDEWQNRANGETRHSATPEQDADYMAAVEANDMKTAQRMVDEAAQKAGYTFGKVYHGTPDNDFTAFNDGIIFFTSNRDTADEYRDPGTMWATRYDKGRTLGAYIKIDNPLMLDNSYSDYRNEHTPWQEWKPTVYGRLPDNAMSATDVAKRAQEEGYDGVFIANDKDTKWSDSAKYLRNRGRGDTVIAFKSNQVKSADPVTYDDNGNVIPLSERFNLNNPDIRYSFTTDKDDYIKGGQIPKELKQWAKDIGLDSISKQPTRGPVIVSVKDLRSAWMQKNGRNDEAEVINEVLDTIGRSLTNTIGKYNYIDLSNSVNATVHYRTNKDGKPTSVILSCQVQNAEYEVNFDFTTICSKRKAMQKVLERFIKTEGEHKSTLYDELKLDEEGMYKLRLILEKAGFEVSCKGCFVEQNRYSQQKQAKTIADDWNKALDEWAKENGTEITDNFDLVNLDINSLDYDEINEAFARYSELIKTKPKKDVATKNRTLIEAHPFFRKRMNPSDYASVDGQRALMAIGSTGGTNLYGLLKRGQSDSKQSVPFTAYNGEVSLLPDNMKGKTLYDYLMSIGGARAQSASDFQIENFYDYMQLVADLAARGLPMHMYTKVIECAELFGMTGIKINLSAMCDVDESLDGEYAGLKLVDGKYEYNISDQSIDYPKAVELQKKPGYSKNIGIIMVTLSKQHMLKSLDDNDVRYIIGYHSSAMPGVVAQMTNMGNATDYTKINKTNKLNEKGRALFAKAMEQAKGETDLAKYKDALRIFDDMIQEEVAADKRKAPRRGNEYARYMSAYGSNTADFNTYEDLSKSGDARKTADNYIEWCMNNDLIPIYFPFAFHDNYYKCEIYDFNMYDNVDGNYAPMEPVQNIYPGLDMTKGETDTTKFMGRVTEMMDEQNTINEALDSQYDNVFDEAKNELRFSITGDEYIDFDEADIDRTQLTPRADAMKTEEQMRDEAYMDAVNSGNMDEAQRLVDEAAKKAMPNTKLKGNWYHGTYNDFTVFDFSQGGKNGHAEGFGIYLSNSQEITNEYGSRQIKSFVNMQRPASALETQTLTRSELRKLIKATVENEAQIMAAEDYDGDVGKAAFDTWISNYTDTYYAGSIDKAIDEVIKSITSYNGNDMDIVQEIMTGMGIRDYDEASKFYDILTDTTGIDGFITKWGDESEMADPNTPTIAVAFRSSQIKSADPVTYADDGSVIPLSQRFDPNNDDIRYSLPTQDSDGNILSDGQMEYFKNSQARDEQGRLVRVYHTTNRGGFTVFDPSYSDDNRSLFFASNFDVSQTYGYKARNPIRYNATEFKRFIDVEKYLRDKFKDRDYAGYDGNAIEYIDAVVLRVDDNQFADELGYQDQGFSKWVKLSESTSKWDKKEAEKYYVEFHVPNKAKRRVSNLSELLSQLQEDLGEDTKNQHGYYECYLNLENPLIVDAQGANWSAIKYGNPELQSKIDKGRQELEQYMNTALSGIDVEFEYNDNGYPIAVELDISKRIKAKDGTWRDDSYHDSMRINEQDYIDKYGTYDDPQASLDMWDFVQAAIGLQVSDSGEFLNWIVDKVDFNGDVHFSSDNLTGYEWFDSNGEWIGEEGYIDEDTVEEYYGAVPTYNTRELAEMAEDQGYDGVIIRNCRDIGGASSLRGGNPISDIYIAFSSNQVKDFENENPTENPDIRYSITPEDDAMEWLASQYELEDVPLDDEQAEEGRVRMAKSKKEFVQSKNTLWNERWLTEGKILDVKSVRKGIKDVVMGAMANSDTSRQYKSDLVDKILVDAKSAYWLMKDGKHAEAAELLWDSAVKMIENVDFIEDETFKSYKSLRDYMRTTSIRLGEEYWSDVDYNEFRKRNYGRIKLVKGDTNIDQVLDDLRELAPEWFSEEAFEKNDLKADVVPDILLQMEAVLDAIQPYKIAYSSEEAEALAGDIADDLYDIVYQGAEYKSIADTFKQRYDEKTKALKQRHREAMRASKERRDELLDEEKARTTRQKERAELWKSRTFEEKSKRRAEKDARKKAKHFGKIQSNIDWLTDRLLNETKDKNIPEGFRKSLAHMLMQFDMQTERSKALEEKYGPAKKTLKMRELKDRLDKIAKEDDTGEFRYDGYLFYLMDALADKVDGKTIDALDTEDLIVIDTMLKSIKHNFSNYNKIRLQEKQVEISEIGENTISAMDERISKYGKRKSYKGVRGMFDKLVNEGEETPIYFFERLDPTGKGIGAMYKELRRGEDKHIRNMDYLRKRFQQMFGDYFNEKKPGSELESWRDNSQSQTFNFANGSITLNPAQMMSLYCLSKRPQALGHILGAGIVSSPVTVGQKLSEQFKGETEQVESVMVTYEEVQQIIAKLTPEQIKLADEMQSLLNNEMAAWGNETSLQMHGIKLFREQDYFPIKSSSEALKKTADSFDTQEKIKNFGFTKPLVRNANNAIMIDDIFSVVADHCNKMSLYNSMAIPISDFMRVYNYTQRNEDGSQKTVQQKIGEAFTRKANDYIMKFIGDVNGNTKTRSDAVNDLMNKALANYKKASIGMNARVALQQPTAIFRALMAIDLKYFAGIKPLSRAETNEMFEHCPIALWKSWGHYDMDMGRDIEDIMMNNDWSRWDTISMGIYGGLDNWTWGLIWQAAKNEVKAKNPSVEVGSDEFFRLANERASEVFDKTQVVDSIFHRSDTMRSKNTLTKMATSFMAEPTLTFNVLRDSLVRANEKLKEGDPSEAGKIFMKMVLVLGLNAAAVSASAAIWDAVRGKGGDDDDDKEFGELWLLNFFENLKDNVNMINNIYFVKDIYGLKDGWGTSNMALEGFELFFKGLAQFKKKITEGSDKSWYDIMMNLLGGAGYITGVPAKTIMRDVKAVFSKLGIDVFAADGTDEVSNEKAGSIADRFLDIFRTDEEKAAAAESRIQKARAKTAEKIKDKYADLSGEERDKKVWSAVTTYFKNETEDSKAFADMVTSGDYASINAMRRVYLAAGGEAEYFDERVLAESKKALKKTIKYGQTTEEIDAQANIQSYLTSHGMTDDEVSDIIYKSDVAKDMKVAFRLGDKDLMLESLEPLVNAGLTYDDLVRLWDNRNRMDLSKYKGRYKDKLKSTGKFIWPTEGVITSHFGYRNAPTAGASSNHPAIDIGAPQGTAVVAADGGTVIYAGRNSGYGNSVGIKHDNGMVTYYNHLYSWNVKVGDTVGQGQQIAQVGSTGISTGPHLDFKILDTNGEPVDPEQYLQKRQ